MQEYQLGDINARFDVVALLPDRNEGYQAELIKDAFEVFT